jgi:hypothetical protein
VVGLARPRHSLSLSPPPSLSLHVAVQLSFVSHAALFVSGVIFFLARWSGRGPVARVETSRAWYERGRRWLWIWAVSALRLLPTRLLKATGGASGFF